MNEEAQEEKATEKTDNTKKASMAIVKTESKDADDADGDGDDDSDIVLSDEDIPFGPLGVFPENYSELQAQVGSLSRLY